MKSILSRIWGFAKKETVLTIAAVLAVISMLFVYPDRQYQGYIDFRTLSVLFCLMTVMSGFQSLDVFKSFAWGMLKKVKSTWQLFIVPVLLCFFFSMIVTNDVALITFVPFSIAVVNMLEKDRKKKLLIPMVVLETIAANLGSMLTPMGNPQNLYLYGQANLQIHKFMGIMLPYSAASLIILVVCCLVLGRGKKEKITLSEEVYVMDKMKLLILYIILLGVCLITVVRILPYQAALIIVVTVVFIGDRKTFRQVDYSLLLTFIAFFVFVGNMGRIEGFRTVLEKLINGNEVQTAILASQVISNVPAALLLNGFTKNVQGLIIGTNLGGLGTLIASMASLISFKYIGREDKSMRFQYLVCFTVLNVVFLAVLAGLWLIIR